MDITKFFSGKKRDPSQDDPKKVKEESEVSCSVNDSNVFVERLDGLYCRNILYNCLKKLKTKVTEIFDLVNTTSENQIKGARKL